MIIFDGWENVPHNNFKTANSWKYEFRKVKTNASHDAEVKATICENPLTHANFKLYSINQTEEFTPSESQIAEKMFWDIFCKQMDKDKHIEAPKDPAKGKWQTITKKDFGYFRGFNKSRLHSHLISGRRIGVFAKSPEKKGKTNFLIIDLDLHKGQPELFLNQVKILLDNFWGERFAFLALNPEKIGGIHLVFVFKKALSVNVAVSILKGIVVK